MGVHSASLTRPQALNRGRDKHQDLQKFHGKCITGDWEEVFLVVTASSEAEASKKLHEGYKIRMVLEIRTEAEHSLHRDKNLIRPSLSLGNHYHSRRASANG